jgi:hypothetical protein
VCKKAIWLLPIKLSACSHTVIIIDVSNNDEFHEAYVGKKSAASDKSAFATLEAPHDMLIHSTKSDAKASLDIKSADCGCIKSIDLII